MSLARWNISILTSWLVSFRAIAYHKFQERAWSRWLRHGNGHKSGAQQLQAPKVKVLRCWSWPNWNSCHRIVFHRQKFNILCLFLIAILEKQHCVGMLKELPFLACHKRLDGSSFQGTDNQVEMFYTWWPRLNSYRANAHEHGKLALTLIAEVSFSEKLRWRELIPSVQLSLYPVLAAQIRTFSRTSPPLQKVMHAHSRLQEEYFLCYFHMYTQEHVFAPYCILWLSPK